MATLINYDPLDKVYWLSSGGFKKGIIKSVSYVPCVSNDDKVIINRRPIFRLWCNDFSPDYMGDTVEEHLIFTSYEEMLGYYSVNKPK